MRRAALLLATAALAAVPAAAQAACPVAPDPGALPDAAQLRDMNAFVASLGVRPTGSDTHERYIEWIRQQLRAIPGVDLREIDYPINRFTPGPASLTLHDRGRDVSLPIADAVPYSAPTGPQGVEAPLAVVPPEQAITAGNAAGKIVVRQADPGSVPNAAFLLPVVSWEIYDPNHTIDPAGTFYGDFINYGPRVTDLRDAAKAGAKGIVFVKPLPRGQLIDHYEPYEGEQFHVAGLFVGADEGKRLTDAVAAGGHPTATLVDDASYKAVQTPSLEATIAGQSPQRIVIDSHTDGTNAVEDNGPVAMIAIARYLAGLPAECRPRTVELQFSTAHFYQRLRDPAIRDGGAEQYAEQLDREYDQGKVSSVLVLEHLGALDYESAPRKDGGPGGQLEPNGLRAIQFIGVTPSPSLVAAVDSVVRTYDMQRSILLQGADAPGPTVPSHCSFGGEGTPYNVHLLPTIGVISAPQYLYDPAFELEAIDFNVMHSELLGFTELVNRLGAMSQAAVAGSVDAERAQRAAGAPGCPQAITTPPYGPAPNPQATGASGRGAPNACASRRRFTLHVRAPRGVSARRARLSIGGRARTVRLARRGGRLGVVVDLRGRPAGTVRVRLTLRDRRGRALHVTRTYRTCARRS